MVIADALKVDVHSPGKNLATSLADLTTNKAVNLYA